MTADDGSKAHAKGSPVPAPRPRLAEILHYNFVDHAILRRRWHNFFEVAPGVYRSNHPNDARFRAYKARGIRTILNLRGESRTAGFRFEQAICAELGLGLVSAKLYARAAPGRKNLLALFDIFRSIEKPFLMHCKSGADRAGLASALWLLAMEGADVATARRQLSWRYLHIRQSSTGILDHFLDLYEARLERGPIPIEDWVRDEYDHREVDSGFRRLRGRT